jgi:hypothetical protein
LLKSLVAQLQLSSQYVSPIVYSLAIGIFI